MMKINQNVNNPAEVFSDLLGDKDTVQYWRAIKEGGPSKKIQGSINSSYTSLKSLNDQGYNIFMTIQKSDGQGVSTKNINRVRAVFIDLDGPPKENIDRFKLTPHIVINSSPGKYHAYWLVRDFPLDEFKKIQQLLATLIDSDRSVSDLARVMRVPGFKHLKKVPFEVVIESINQLPAYTYEQIENAIPKLNAVKTIEKFSLDDGVLEGVRHTALTSLCGKLIYLCMSDEEALNKLKYWNSKNKPPLPNEEIYKTYHSIKVKDDLERGEERLHLKYFNDNYSIVCVGGKTLIKKEFHDQSFQSDKDFRLFYAHKKIKDQAAAKIWLESEGANRYASLEFLPGGGCPDGVYNLFKGFAVEPVEGDCGLYLNHIKEVICNGESILYDYVIKWMAHAIQKPEELPGVALVLRGKQGTGKGQFVSYFGKLFGGHYKHLISMEHFLGRFSGHLKDALLMFADEVVWGGNKKDEGFLKGMITEKKRIIEEKYTTPYMLKNYSRFIFATNESWAVPSGPNERRYCVLDIDDSYRCDFDYFSSIENQMAKGGLEALMYHLSHLDIKRFNVRDYPLTIGLLSQKEQSLGSVETWWRDRLASGDPCGQGFSSMSQLFDSNPLTTELFSDYEYFKQNERHGISAVNSCNQFVIRLKNIAPVINERKMVNGERSRRLKVPGLGICREHYEKYIGHPVDWEE